MASQWINTDGDTMRVEPTCTEPVLDVRKALERLDGDDSLLVDLIGFFLEDSPGMLEDLQQAAAARNASQLQMSAHALKGLVASCGGARAAVAAQRVEHAGAANELGNINALLATLTTEIQSLRSEAEGYTR
jgi:HPt (histidine-containing phosphotransfer) domain-containing protein